MKKIFLAVLLFITILLGNNVFASTWKFEWFNTTVEVKVGSSIYDYTDIPYAKLYKDDVELLDADVKIVSTGDWLYYLENVDTETVGEYYVWYKAYEYTYMPGTCHNYKCLITFRVVDDVAPTIKQIVDNIRIPRGNENYDLRNYFQISDNYDNDLDIEFYHSIDTKTVGIYDCKVRVVDDNQNDYEHEFKVEVYYTGTPPKIEKLVSEIRLKKGSKIELEKYFRITDDDLDLITSDIYHDIDSKIPGIYKCKIIASDSYDETILEFDVEIYDDNVSPTITQLTDKIRIEYGATKLNLSDYFIITDDYDTSFKPTFIHNINVNEIGYYDCKIIVSDSSDKVSELAFVVEVFGDVTNPSVTQTVDKIRIKRKSSYDLSKYFIFQDDSGDECSVKFYHQIDSECVGIYNCKALISDSSGNSIIHNFEVEIYDDTKPVITFLGEGGKLNLYLNKEILIKSYFKASDDIDGDITDKIYFPSIDKSVAGEKDYVISVSDKAGNTAEYEIKINVIDDIIPEITLYNESITLNFGFSLEAINYLSYVKVFNDNNQVLDKSLINVSSNLDTNVGQYSVVYTYSDSYNTVIKELSITVLSTKAPTITTTNITINPDEVVDLYSYIVVEDLSDTNVASSLIVDDSMVDYSTAGRYEATAYAINSSGLSSIVTFYIIVENENIFDSDIVRYISMGLVGLLVVSLGVIYFIKNKKIKNV